MSRVIKFRAFDGKTMAYMKGMWFEPLLNTSKNINQSISLNVALSDSAITVMQYTGLKDKNGVEIYDGDILSMWYAPQSSCKGVVSFEYGAFWFDTSEAIPKRDLVSALTSYGNEIEVIGNIHQNKELLE